MGPIEVTRDGFAAKLDPEDRLAPGGIRRIDRDDIVEPARAKERRIETVDAIGGGQYEYPGQLLNAVHLGQQLGQNPVGDRILAPSADWTDGVDLIKEENAGGGAASFPKQLTHGPLAIADEFREQFRAFNG